MMNLLHAFVQTTAWPPVLKVLMVLAAIAIFFLLIIAFVRWYWGLVLKEIKQSEAIMGPFDWGDKGDSR